MDTRHRVETDVATDARRPLLTIAIPTFNRCALLKQLLQCLSSQIPDDGSVQVIVSDNGSSDETTTVIKAALERGVRLEYIRNEANIGPDANFLQCYERAAGKYAWIFSDDDLLRPGALGHILNHLSQDEYDLVYVSSAGFEGDPPAGASTVSTPRVSVFNDAAQFVRKVHIFTTMISGNIINKDRVEAVAHEPFSKLIDSSLIQLGWTFTALKGHKKSLFIEDKLIDYRLGNTGGYGVCRVFGTTLSQITRDWLGVPHLNRLILNASLQRLLPQCIVDAKRNPGGSYLTEDPHTVLSSIFAGNIRYWFFDYPLIVLPSNLAWLWLQALRVINRIDRAFGLPSLDW